MTRGVDRTVTELLDGVPEPSAPDGEVAVDWVERVTRVGWLAKGFVFVVIGGIALQIALGLGSARESADQRGALRALADRTFGSVLLACLAAGLAVFAVWKLVQAVAGRSSDIDPLGVAKRIGWAGLGVFYGALAWMALMLATGDRGTDDGTSAAGLTARLMGAPGGRWLIGAAGLTVLCIAAYHARKGLTYDFVDDLDTDDLGPNAERWIGRFGVGGFLARAVVLAVSGWFLLRAAVRFDPDDAVGLDGALRQLAGLAYGRIVLVAVSIGLVIAGLYDMATFRRQQM